MYFSYDGNGDIMSVNYIDQNYYYVRNPQGDVVALVNESGEIVDEYTYDAWGKPTSTPTSRIGQFNPFRYRGYIYDDETGFYYASSRYYDPETGRWLNADRYISTGKGILGYNMFAYCNNNPIMYFDPTGEISVGVIIMALIVIGGAVIGGVAGYNSDERLIDNAPDTNKKDNDIGLEVTKDVLPQKQSEPAFVSYSSISTKSEEKLTTKDRVVNTVIGASLGAAAAGGIIAIGGVALSLGAGATTVIAGVGMTGAQISAIGALVYNGFAMVVAPFLGVEVEPLEYAP